MVCYEQNCIFHPRGERFFDVTSEGTSQIGTEKIRVEIKGCGAQGQEGVCPEIIIVNPACNQYRGKER